MEITVGNAMFSSDLAEVQLELGRLRLAEVPHVEAVDLHRLETGRLDLLAELDHLPRGAGLDAHRARGHLAHELLGREREQLVDLVREQRVPFPTPAPADVDADAGLGEPLQSAPAARPSRSSPSSVNAVMLITNALGAPRRCMSDSPCSCTSWSQPITGSTTYDARCESWNTRCSAGSNTVASHGFSPVFGLRS